MGPELDFRFAKMNAPIRKVTGIANKPHPEKVVIKLPGARVHVPKSAPGI